MPPFLFFYLEVGVRLPQHSAQLYDTIFASAATVMKCELPFILKVDLN